MGHNTDNPDVLCKTNSDVGSHLGPGIQRKTTRQSWKQDAVVCLFASGCLVTVFFFSLTSWFISLKHLLELRNVQQTMTRPWWGLLCCVCRSSLFSSECVALGKEVAARYT